MTVATQGNKTVQLVVSECTPKVDVVNFELRRVSTLLTSPAISFKNLLAK